MLSCGLLLIAVAITMRAIWQHCNTSIRLQSVGSLSGKSIAIAIVVAMTFLITTFRAHSVWKINTKTFVPVKWPTRLSFFALLIAAAAWSLSITVATSHEFTSLIGYHGIVISSGPGSIELVHTQFYSGPQAGLRPAQDDYLQGLLKAWKYNCWSYSDPFVCNILTLPVISNTSELISGLELGLSDTYYGKGLPTNLVFSSGFVGNRIIKANPIGSIVIPFWPLVPVLFVCYLRASRTVLRNNRILQCSRCGYNLRGCTNPGCPECGLGRPLAESRL